MLRSALAVSLLCATLATSNIMMDLANVWHDSEDHQQVLSAAALYETQGDLPHAIAALQRCVTLDAIHRSVYLIRAGELASLLGEHERAAAMFRSAAKSDAMHTVWELRADAEANRAQLDELLPPAEIGQPVVLRQAWQPWANTAASITKKLRRM